MRSRKLTKLLPLVLGVLFVVTLSAAVVYAQGEISTRYIYMGKDISREEILRRYNAHEDLHCVQQITEQTLRNDAADLFVCFDTLEEARQNSEEIKPMVEYYNQVLQQRIQDHRISQPQKRQQVPEKSCDHWALFANSGYSNWLFDLCNGQSNSNHTGVWSIWRDGNPHDITIFQLPNFQAFSYTYSSAQWTLIGLPFGGGGGRSSSVP